MEVEQRPKGGVVGEAEKRSDLPSRERLVELLNEDLAREYQAIISDDAEAILRFDLDNENQTVAAYRERVKQCEAMGELALAEEIREILRQEQEHQIDLATALGEDVPDVSRPSKRAR